MTPKQISYFTALCLMLILATQVYLTFEYFQTTRAGLVRESDAILEEAFKNDLEIRRRVYKLIENDFKVDVSKPSSKSDRVIYDFSKRSDYADNVMGLIDLGINNYISKYVPIKIQQLDSITGTILKKRNIIDPTTDKIREKANSKLINSSVFVISSKYLTIDIIDNKALQLVLVNPFGIIIKRMGLMLISSIALAVLCMFAFRFLLRVLARQKQLVAFKNEFLGTIAHELKRPMASLSFNLDCLSLPTSAANKLQHELLLSRSVGATMELNATINMIVALTKLEEGLLVLNKEPVNLNQMFEELKNKFVSYAAKKVEIQMVYEADEILLKADANLLNQCFANLIDNSIKYSDNEVLIIINIRKTGQWILVSIKDNGYGISAEKLPKIFEKYNRAHTHNTKINGFGIGLNYVKTIVEKHKGEVDVKSQEGEGSEFSVLLPA